MSMTLAQLATRIGATVVGDGAAVVSRCAPIDDAGPGDVTFLSNAKYAQYLQHTKASAVVIDAATECPSRLTRLVCPSPYFAFRNAMVELHGFRAHPLVMGGRDGETHPPGNGISPHASVHRSARIGPGSVIHPCAVVEAGAAVGERCILYPGVYIGRDTKVGDDCVLYPNVVVYERCVIGNRVSIHANCTVGHDGFGYATHEGAHHKIPQAGIVVIDDDVELGAGCAVERAAMGETRIGKGTKFADLISIGHGTTVGKHCLFVSLVGVSGSVDVGNYVVLGGQVGVSGHLKIGDGVQAMARTAIAQDVSAGQKVGGAPAIPFDQAKRNALAGTELYELFKRVRKLERELQQLSQSSTKATT